MKDPFWFEPSALEFRKQTLERIEGWSSRELSDEAVRLEAEQGRFLEQSCLNLYPGTNILSPRVARLLGSTTASRAAEGHPGAKYQTGLHWVEEAEAIASELICRVFGSSYAEVRCLSGSMANTAVLNSLTEPGETIFSLTAPVGGHISHTLVGVAGYRRLRIEEIPYRVEDWSIDLDRLRKQVKLHPPKLIILGGSLILFGYPLREVRAIADEVGAYVMYDAAHVAGMVAGGVWQHPLQEGAHVMTASTYKSFAGPPGGIVITNDGEIARGVDRAIFPGMTANFHTNRMPALLAAAADFLEFGRQYAVACHANARTLSEAFQSEGLCVAGAEKGSSDGHMLALDVRDQGMGKSAALALEKAHIICNFNLLPWDSLKVVRNPSGLRLAVHEVTRWGMGASEMNQIARLFRRVLVDREDPLQVAPVVEELKQQFNEIHYCFV